MATTLAWGEDVQVFMEIGFPIDEFTLDSSTLDGTDVLDGQERQDVAQYVTNISLTRGRSDQFSIFRAGVLSVTLRNDDRRFDPINQSGPYWNPATGSSGLTPRRKVELYLDGVAQFIGSITDIDIEYDNNPNGTSTVTISAADDFIRLANTAISADVTPSVELSGARVETILDRAEVDFPAATREIDAGTISLGAYQIDANTNALQYLQKCAEAEQGLFFVKKDGTLRFTDRITASFSSPVATFSDDGTDISYQSLTTLYGQEFLFNRVQVSRFGGSVQSAEDVGSQGEYGVITLDFTDMLLETDGQASTLASYLVDLYKEPEYRFDEVTVSVNRLSESDRTTLLGLELGDVVTVERNFPNGTPSVVADDYGIETITHSITPNRHEVTIGFYNVDLVFEFTLDDATYGVLDADNALT